MVKEIKAALIPMRWRCWQCGTGKSLKCRYGENRIWQCRNCRVWCVTDWKHHGRESRPLSGEGELWNKQDQ
jgi:hypothetical protein